MADTERRHFTHLVTDVAGPDRWTHEADHHTFTLFWARLDDLPAIVSPQDEWLPVLFEHLSRQTG